MLCYNITCKCIESLVLAFGSPGEVNTRLCMAALQPMHGRKQGFRSRRLAFFGRAAYLKRTGQSRPGSGVTTMTIRKIEPARQAPEASQGNADSEPVKRQVAKHELLDANGAVVEDEEVATGIRYTLLANNQSFEFQSGMTAGERNTMLVIFGAKTLATNESSALRNSTKGEATPDEQIDAVRERFALLETGKWVDRTREGAGARIDLDALANAICSVMVAEGKYTNDQVATEKLAATRAKLEDDKVFARKARQHPPFAAEYAKLKGAQTVTVDDFAL